MPVLVLHDIRQNEIRRCSTGSSAFRFIQQFHSIGSKPNPKKTLLKPKPSTLKP
jgi:hypothetical protein